MRVGSNDGPSPRGQDGLQFGFWIVGSRFWNEMMVKQEVEMNMFVELKQPS
jgi:hypothetical protein